MKHKLLITIALSGIMAFAQGRGPMGRPAGPGGFGFGGRGQGGATVTGAPYSAVETSTFQETLADGNTINRSHTVKLARDSQGRTRTEVSIPADTATGRAATTEIVIHDPAGHQTITLDSTKMTARVVHMPGFTPSSSSSNSGSSPQARSGRAPGAAPGRAGGSNSTSPAPAQRGRNGGSVNSEVLGVKLINNTSATGTRETQVIAAGRVGNSAPLTVTREIWYSTDLKRNILESVTDPQHGNRRVELTNIVQGEPGADLFAIPAGYTTQNGRLGFGNGRGPGGPAPANRGPRSVQQ